MTTAILDRAGSPRGETAAPLARLARWLRARALAARTRLELERMTDRELADIGLMRCDIARIAREAARAA